MQNSQAEKQGWYWPQFEKILCGKMSERALLGLPDFFSPGRFADLLAALYEGLRSKGKDELLEMIADRTVPLAARLVAGNLLGVAGDPRIATFNPLMISIKGGTKQIGLSESDLASVLSRYAGLGLDEKWIRKECPRHSVHISDFKIAQFPVTNQEYKDFLIDSRYTEIPSSWAFGQYPVERANHPVYTVSPVAAQAYADWLSTKTGRKFRLPTEAEWEYAAAGPDGFEFPWGDAYEPDFANTGETGLLHSTPVGIFVEGNSVFGVADLAGNVEEYVIDMYAPYPGGSFVTDHLVEANSEYRIARGGSFARFRDLARTRRRHGHNPGSVVYVMGFRLVEDI